LMNIISLSIKYRKNIYLKYSKKITAKLIPINTTTSFFKRLTGSLYTGQYLFTASW
jgi:hypothetical protein